MEVPAHLIPLIDEMYFELSSNRLEVEVIREGDADRGIRCAVSKNPSWYQDLCANNPCTRLKRRRGKKDWTRIKRRDTLETLERMLKFGKSKSQYAVEIIDTAQTRYESYERLRKIESVPWDNQF